MKHYRVERALSGDQGLSPASLRVRGGIGTDMKHYRVERGRSVRGQRAVSS